jgi:hypothetical protein
METILKLKYVFQYKIYSHLTDMGAGLQPFCLSEC